MLLAFALCLCLASASLYGQTSSSQITGTVTDQSGAVMVGVKVMSTSLTTNITNEAVTNEQGLFRFFLVPGSYRIQAEMGGFKGFSLSPVPVQVDEIRRVDISMNLGESTEIVEVSAQATAIETENASVGEVVTERSVQELPLAIRDTFGLVTLTAGVVTGGNFGEGGATEVGRPQFRTDFKIGGGRALGTDVLFDGAANSGADGNFAAYVPPAFSTQEFKVQVNSYSAEYGRTTGGVVTMVSKSGTNQYRGMLYEFHRNAPLDANNFFANRAGRDRPAFIRHQFGANIGGPVPGLKDKTFFFYSYEGLRQGVPFAQLRTVPTDIQRQGDFSQTRNFNGQQVVIYDPNTLQQVGNAFTRTPFPNNLIPAARRNEVAMRMLNLFPQANAPGDQFTNANNYSLNAKQVARTNNNNLRIDHNWNNNHRTMGRVSTVYFLNTDPLPFESFPAALNDDSAWNFLVGHTYTITPTTILDIRLNYTRHETLEVSPSNGFDLASLGLPQSYKDAAQPFIPNINPAGMTGIGRNRNLIQPRETPSGQAILNKQFGSHLLKIGAEVRRPQFNVNRNLNASGTFNFGTNFTQGPNPLQASQTAGFGLASMMLGLGSGGSMFITTPYSIYRWYYAGYIQDDWKVSRKLTVNLGLRYDLNVGTQERYDRLNSLELNAPSPLQVPGMNLRGFLEFRGQGVDRSITRTDRNDFAPRIGLAYQLNQDTVIRAGYGIFYTPLLTINGVGTLGLDAETPWVATIDGGLTPENTLSNPYPQGFVLPSTDRNPLTNVGLAINSSTRDDRTGYSQQWSFGIQRMLPQDTLIEVGYLGNKGSKLMFGDPWQLNWLPNELLALGAQLNQQVDNPFFGIIESGPLSGPRISRRQSLLPYPQYTGVNREFAAAASSIYHAMTVRMEKRTRVGLTLLGSYTVSKQIDDSSTQRGFLDHAPGILDMENLRLERSVSSFDVPQRLVASFVYDMPFGRGKALGSNMPKALDFALGGWVIAGIATFQSGLPIAVSRPSLNNGTSAKLDNPTIDRWFDTSVFSAAPAFTFGNVGRLLPDVRGDGLHNLDFNISKNFFIKERYRFQLRGEAFNLTNTPTFGLPVGGVTNANFGRVNSQRNAPRAVQIAAQFHF
ncbi:MAG: TonB-dependent receptor [Bryobacterales bacterium]|nr:TonB-dependent receptor [Bryobacterales bacterium]